MKRGTVFYQETLAESYQAESRILLVRVICPAASRMVAEIFTDSTCGPFLRYRADNPRVRSKHMAEKPSTGRITDGTSFMLHVLDDPIIPAPETLSLPCPVCGPMPVKTALLLAKAREALAGVPPLKLVV